MMTTTLRLFDTLHTLRLKSVLTADCLFRGFDASPLAARRRLLGRDPTSASLGSTGRLDDTA